MISPWMLAEVPHLVHSLSKHIGSDKEVTPRGDDHPVILYPGFTASNTSMSLMRRLLKANGHNVVCWNHHRNNGMNEKLIAKLVVQVRLMAEESEQRVSLVGHSLGGTIARTVANIATESVAGVVTIGSPINNLDGVLDRVKDKYDAINHTHTSDEAWEEYKDTVTRALQVPCTSIWSAKDGIVPNAASIVAEPLGENIEVGGGHFSMIVDPVVIYHIAVAISSHSSLITTSNS